ncbi:MAG: TonB-dependent receptor, partial [Gammaproteobacteria bacterium]|nr:TonB-dependent receptor [Gammaproteobacteria bacterium]
DESILEASNPEGIFTADNIGESAYLLSNETSPTDNYEAKQTIFGTYLKGEVVLTKNLKMMTGVRWETAFQEVSTFKLLSPDEKDTVSLDKNSFLPAFSATWQAKADQQFRFALSQTVNRPDFKELSEAPYIDPETRDLVRGNKKLQPATISHADLRWEWYLTRFETFSVATFYKKFDSPIERVIRLGGGGVHTFSNAESANIYGIEMQGRTWLSRLFGRSFSRFYVESNLALINSSVDLGKSGSQLTTNNRPLQGQSPWLVNFTLAYENLVARAKASLLLNMSGERIVGVGTSGLPDSYQQPVPQLDFVFSKEIYEGSQDKLKLKMKIKNILDPEYITKQEDKVTKRYRKGVSGSMTLEYKWK